MSALMKKLLCTLLCAALLLSTACSAQNPPAQLPAEDSAPQQEVYVPQAPEDAEEERVYLSENSAEYRALYTDNAIEEALDERFANALTAEDFEALSIDYSDAWKEEYHALMEQLIALYPDDADELKGLYDYTDEAAQAAYDEEYAHHLYLDENGQEQVGMAAVQSGHFAMAEVYKQAAVLSILNDYREAEPYEFQYKPQIN